MPQCDTEYFGVVSYEDSEAIEFSAGLPGFENCHRFLPIDEAARRPFIFLQSLEQPGLCFLTLPVLAIEPGYQLKISAEDVAAIGFEKQPSIGSEALCLAIVTMAEAGVPTANLLAPIVVHPGNRRAVQAVRDDAAYGCRYTLVSIAEVAPCS